MNFIVPMMDRGALELACERAPYVDFFLAEPDATLVELVGGVCGWQVETAEEARAAEAGGLRRRDRRRATSRAGASASRARSCDPSWRPR